jgi:diguanylate cyclase (GGDEF)-like protein
MRRRSLSLLTYALLGTGLVLTALAGTAVLSWREIEQLEREVAEEYALLAEGELRAALSRVHAVSRAVLDELADWDELRQQLHEQRYYGYWVKHRAREGIAAPDFVKAVHLYGLDGQELGPEGGPVLTADIASHLDGYPYQPVGYSSFVAVRPVRASRGSYEETIGYVLIELDLLEALNELGAFRRLVGVSLSLDPPTDEHASPRAVADRFRYAVAENRGVVRMSALMGDLSLTWTLLMLGGALLLLALVAVVVVRPMRRLANHIDALREKGGGMLLSSLGAPVRVTEFDKLRRSLNDYEMALQDVHSHLDEKNRQLWKLAHSDPLTQASNRRALEDDWTALVEIAHTRRTGAALLLFDCDHFKAINDTYGHQVGDRIIQGLAEALQSALRRGDKLYRLGGDEFASLLMADTSEFAVTVGRRCIEAVREYDFRSQGLGEPVRVSVGVAFAADVREARLERLHREADSAMYLAKRPGRDHLAVYDPAKSAQSDSLLSSHVISDVYEALEHAERICLHYQPVHELATGEVAYYEALVRLRHGDELLMPSLVFPVIESHRLERELDVAVMRAVLADLESGHLPAGSGVAVNFAGPSLQDPEVVRALDALHAYLDRYRIVLEVTETLLITHMEGVASALDRLRRKGFVIALDDFGSGYSSLLYLAQMPVDVVKFDIALTGALQGDDAQATLIADLARMVRRAGYRIVAEGVEQPALLAVAQRVGFDYVQGYLVGRPGRACVLPDGLPRLGRPRAAG